METLKCTISIGKRMFTLSEGYLKIPYITIKNYVDGIRPSVAKADFRTSLVITGRRKDEQSKRNVIYADDLELFGVDAVRFCILKCHLKQMEQYMGVTS